MYFAHVHGDLNQRILSIFEGCFFFFFFFFFFATRGPLNLQL